MARKKAVRKGLAKMGGRPKQSKFEQDLSTLRKVSKSVADLSPDARRWLRSRLSA